VSGTGFSSAIGSFVIGLSPIEGSLVPPPGPVETPDAGLPADLARLYDNIQMTLPGITVPVIELELWSAVQEFCIRGTYFRARVEWRMGQGQSVVDFNPFSHDMVVVWVLFSHGLTHWEINPPAQLVDLMVPTADRHGWALLALRPVVFNTLKLGTMPELFTTWYETMLDGTMFRLYGMPAKPWSSTQLAQYHGTRFRQGINRARDIAERLHSHQQSPARAFPYFARGRRKN
jgi:hypothetical protein